MNKFFESKMSGNNPRLLTNSYLRIKIHFVEKQINKNECMH